ADVLMIGSGALAPLEGFLDERDYGAVLATARLASGSPIGLPVLLRVTGDEARQLRRLERIALFDAGRPVGVLEVADAFEAPAAAEAAAVYGTEDLAHPGVAALHAAGTHALAGRVTAFAPPRESLGPHDLTPRQVREGKAARG